MITSWKEMPILILEKIEDIGSTHISDEEKTFRTTALLAGMDYEEFITLPLSRSTEMIEQTAFLYSDIDSVRMKKEYELNGKRYKVFRETEMNVAQYLDYQALLNVGISHHLPDMLSIVLIPEGHTYGDGYNRDEVMEDIRNNLSVAEAKAIGDFFTRRFSRSMRRMLNWSEAAATAARVMAPKREKEKAIAEETAVKVMVRELRSMFGLDTSRR